MNRSERRKHARSKGTRSARAAARSFEASLERARGHLLSGQLDEAEKLCDGVLAKQRANAEAMHIKGLAARGRGHAQSAIDCLTGAAKAAPERADIQYNLGIAFGEAKRLEEAEEAYRRAIALDPGNPNYHNNLGSLLNRIGRHEDALESFKAALGLDENHLQARGNLGSTLLELKQPEAAISELRRAVAAAPDYADAHNNLANAYVDAGDSAKAIDAYAVAIALRPGAAVFHYNLGNALLDTGAVNEAIAAYRQSLALEPSRAEIRSNYLYSLQFEPEVTSQKLLTVHEDWNSRHGKMNPVGAYAEARFDPDRRLRLGFVSADFGRHPVGYFLVRPLECLDRSQTEIICYSNRVNVDETTERLMAASDNWIDARQDTNEQLARRIWDDEIDILFEISGHSRGNRLGIYAMKPAPLQISWGIGYPGATGLDAIDALLTDARHIPHHDAANFKERLLHLPQGQFCFDPPVDAPDVSSLPAIGNGHITFGCLSQPRKINGMVLDAWSRIFAAVPDSRLILGYGGMDDAANVSRIIDEFGAGGISPDRITILGSAPHGDFLGRYNMVDLSLDTFPYSGGLTTLEALWMGVPMITFPGKSCAGRHAAGHLSAMGLNELIADDLDGYRELAVKLAGDTERLAGLRAGLRSRLAASPICDGPGFAADFLAAVRDLWRERCIEGAKPGGA